MYTYIHNSRRTKVPGQLMVPVCFDCEASLNKVPVTMPKFALANGLWLGRLPPIASWAKASITASQPCLGHRMLMPLARVAMINVVCRPGGNDDHGSWQDAFNQKGLRGSVIMFPNALQPKVDEFPQPDLADIFAAVFVGIKSTDLTQATFAKVNKEDFKKEAEFVMKTNAVYNKARFREELVEDSQERVQECFVFQDESSEADAKNEGDTPEDEGLAGDMRQTGPSAAVEGDAGDDDNGEDKVAPWTSVLPDVGLEDLPVGGALAVAQAKFEQMEKVVARTRLAEKKAEIDAGVGPEDEAGRKELLTLCEDAQKTLKKTTNINQDAVEIEEAVRRAEGVRKTKATEPRLIVPSGGKPLSFFDPEFWTRGAPYEWVYGDCSWGHAEMDVALSITEFIRCLWYREELQYTTPTEATAYVAPPVNRFRHPAIVHILASVWRTTQTLTAVNAWVRQKGMFKLLATITKMTPELMRDAMLAGQSAGSFRSVMANEKVPGRQTESLHNITIQYITLHDIKHYIT